jgi:hypothetical protein
MCAALCAPRRTQYTRNRYRREAVRCAPPGNIDYVDRPVTQTGDKQLVVAECHIHWLAAYLDNRLLAKYREWPQIDIADMGALNQIDNAEKMSRIGIAVIDPIAEDRHTGKPLMWQDK